jgi:hypothetical protein
VYDAARVRRWLERLVGDPFDAERARRLIERRYEFLGYAPRVEVALANGLLQAEVLEAVASVADVAVAGKDAAGRQHVPARAVRTRPGDLVNAERLAQDAYDLALLGYAIVPVPATSSGGEGGEARAAGSPIRYAVLRREPRRAGGGEGPEPAGLPAGPLRRSWISGSADYSRRQLFTARLAYQRAHVFREFDLLELSPYVARRPAGAVRYHLPYLLPAPVTAWNVFAELKLYDEFVPDRRFEDAPSGAASPTTVVQTDEERRGVRLALGVEPFRHRGGHSLRAYGYLDRFHVSFGRFAIPVNGGIVPRTSRVPGGRLNDLDVAGFSVEYAFEHLFRPPRLSWRFIPEVEVATKAWGGDVAFRRAAGEIQQHYAFASGLEIDARWRAGIVDRRVPLFEQFSLGGADSLRGFLRDDFLGRRFLSAQNDLWIPIPFLAMAPDSALMASLQRNLKAALTLDAGSVSVEDALAVRFARGIGLGLRWSSDRSPLVVRADVAWGHWRGESRWYPYLSFSRRW